MTDTCCRTGCGREATRMVMIRCWAKGYARMADQAIKMVPSLTYCRDCAKAETPESIVTDEIWAIIERLMAGRAPPDRASISVEPISIAMGVRFLGVSG